MSATCEYAVDVMNEQVVCEHCGFVTDPEYVREYMEDYGTNDPYEARCHWGNCVMLLDSEPDLK